jgi:hypothetical protein
MRKNVLFFEQLNTFKMWCTLNTNDICCRLWRNRNPSEKLHRIFRTFKMFTWGTNAIVTI